MTSQPEEDSEIQQFGELVAVHSRTIDAATRLLNGFKQKRIANDSHQQFVLITLHHMIQKCMAILAMANATKLAGIHMVARSVLETYADLKNLLKLEDSYPLYMEWLSLHHQSRFLEGVDQHAELGFKRLFETDLLGKYGKTMAQAIAQIRSDMEAHQKRLTAAYKDSKGKVRTQDKHRFELADELGMYNVPYRYFCGSAHGKLSAMVDGVMVGEAFRWPPVETPERPLIALDTASIVLTEACARVAEKYGRSVEVFRKLTKAREHLFAKYQPGGR